LASHTQYDRLALKKDVDSYHDLYKVEAELYVRRKCLLTIGRPR
jgi:hypothetical protein